MRSALGPGANLIKLFGVNLITLFKSCIFSQHRKIMSALKEWSSLQKSVSKVTPKRFYKNDPKSQSHNIFVVHFLTLFVS